ncbi:hypothetical protein Q763_06040 [Flavobacterium beibuense F44-8]|uniref:PKD domain-containing protein n=1 Tax=Flavobacterium beibuense F44-8 TaxID=1406840 RepID=A0A0A2M2X4_9FLAO|nr:hypothetical protein [Flavobacterium beibuense]KGO82650.1 hypothetical protein Q763_06040 [Flavobacterium beibuense F44-8]
MKKYFKIITVLVFAGALFSCDPQEDRDDFPALTLSSTDLNISVTQDPENANRVIMTNSTQGIIPYWNYVDAEGNDLGHSNKHQNAVMFPFAGTYTVYFTAYTQGGPVAASPIVVTIDSNNEEYFSDPEWGMLTNGVDGKTWELDFFDPIGWAGLDFPYNPDGSDYWNWFPDYAGNSWVMEEKDWGEMSFNLDGGYNSSVTQTALNSNDQTTKEGGFSFDIEGHSLTFTGGVELLYGGDYYPDVSNWTTTKVVELTENSLRLAVIRDQSRTGEGVCLIVFHYKPKE